ncbi:MAG: hypothetical protein HQM06_16425 [Magnetococcales bacterium]|nr:hypothetical protein [Magnetococcales bacterium]
MAEKVDDRQGAIDSEWYEWVSVKIGSHPKLSKSQRQAVERDFGMKVGEKIVPIRKVILYYFLHRWGLDLDPEMSDPRYHRSFF